MSEIPAELEAATRDALHAAAESGARPTDAGWAIIERSALARRRHRRLQRAGIGIVSVAATIALVAMLVVRTRAGDGRVDTGPAQPGTTEGSSALFPFATNTTLVVDDGYSGVTIIDLDAGAIEHRELDGFAPGDDPVRLARVGGRFVYPCRPGACAVPIDLSSPPTRLGDAVSFVPAAGTSEVWLVAADDPAERIFTSPMHATRVDLEGRVTHQPVDLTVDHPDRPAGSFVPEAGSPNRLYFNERDGVKAFDVDSRSVTALLGSPTCRSMVASEQRLFAFATNAEGRCVRWSVIDLATGAQANHERTGLPVLEFDASSALTVSPDGTRMATVLTVFPNYPVMGRLSVVPVDDPDPRREATLTSVDAMSVRATWSADGTKVFAIEQEREGLGATLWGFDVRSGSSSSVPLPAGWYGTMIAVDRATGPPVRTDGRCDPLPPITPSSGTAVRPPAIAAPCAFDRDTHRGTRHFGLSGYGVEFDYPAKLNTVRWAEVVMGGGGRPIVLLSNQAIHDHCISDIAGPRCNPNTPTMGLLEPRGIGIDVSSRRQSFREQSSEQPYVPAAGSTPTTVSGREADVSRGSAITRGTACADLGATQSIVVSIRLRDGGTEVRDGESFDEPWQRLVITACAGPAVTDLEQIVQTILDSLVIEG